MIQISKFCIAMHAFLILIKTWAATESTVRILWDCSREILVGFPAPASHFLYYLRSCHGCLNYYLKGK